jgi:hypothetical protein
MKEKGRANLKEMRAARVYAHGAKEKEQHTSNSHAHARQKGVHGVGVNNQI